MTRHRSLRLAATLLTMALLAAACSDDTLVEAGTAESDNAVADPPPVADSADPADSGDDASSQVGPYCAIAAQSDALNDEFDAFEETPESLASYYGGQADLLAQAASEGPDAIADELAVLTELNRQTIEILDAADWDVESSAPELAALYETPEAVTASAVLESFETTFCTDIPTANDPPPEVIPTPFDVPADAAAYCAHAVGLSDLGEGTPGTTAADAEAFYADVVDILAQMVAVAPAEIATHLSVMFANFETVYDILEEAAWNIEVGFDAVAEWSADPLIGDPMDVAIDRISQFDEEVCGITF